MTKTQKATNPMIRLYRRLSSEIKINPKFVRNEVLPGWWEDAIAENAAGYAEALGIIARNLALDLESLQGTGKIQRRAFGKVHFKHKANTASDELYLAKSIALRVAELAAKCAVPPAKFLPADPAQIRQEILMQGEPYVGLKALLAWCWDHGIVVVPLTKFPSAAHKMDGLAANIESRPVIVLSKAQRQSAWQAFILAHELGHILLGHTRDVVAIMDSAIQPSNTEDSEDQEDQANRFARGLLTGNPFISYTASRNLTTDELQEAVQLSSKEHNVDPGIIALNYAWSKRFYNTTQLVLKRLEPQVDALAMIRDQFCRHMDFSQLPENSADYLVRITDPTKA